MSTKSKFFIFEHMYTVLIGVFLTFSFTLSSLTSTTILYDFYILLAYCAMFVSFFYVITIFKKGPLIFFSAIFASFLIFMIAFFSMNGIQGSVDIISDQIIQLLNLLAHPHLLTAEAQLVATLIISGMFSFFAVLCIGRKIGYIIITVFGVVFFTAQLITNNFHLPNHTISFQIFIFLLPVIILTQTNKRFFKQNDMKKLRPSYANALILLPICFLVVFASFKVVNPKTQINEFDWSRLFSNFYINDGIGEFNLFRTGFGEQDGRLGGKVTLDDTQVLQLTSDTPIYLAGHTKDTYTGYMWEESKQEKVRYDNGIFAETDQTMSYLDSESGARVPSKRNSYLRYLNIDIRTVLRPSKMDTIIMPDDEILWTNANGDLYMNNFIKRGFEYSFDFYSIRANNYARQLRTNAPGDYTDILGPDNPYTQKRPSFARYLAVSQSVSQRVRDLTMEITSKHDNDYDKITALVSYLSQFPYTLETTRVPHNVDFVDYFLFEEKKGYCSYYASALAIMARIAGIPSRYVEGYAPTYRVKYNDAYIITNEQAHSWVEIYFNDAGWILFEPTPPFNQINNGLPPTNDMFTSEMLSIPEYVTYLRNFNPIEAGDIAISDNPNDGGEEIKYVPQGTTDEVTDDVEYEAETVGRSFWDSVLNFLPYVFYFIIIPILVIGVIIILIEIISNRKNMSKHNILSPKLGIIYYCERLLKLTNYDRNPIFGTESMCAYANRISEKYPFRTNSIMDAALIFENVSYSNEKATREQYQQIMDIYNKYDDYIKSSNGILGKIRFIISRYILWRL